MCLLRGSSLIQAISYMHCAACTSERESKLSSVESGRTSQLPLNVRESMYSLPINERKQKIKAALGDASKTQSLDAVKLCLELQ